MGWTSPDLTNLKGDRLVCLAPVDTLAVILQTCFKPELLVTLEALVTHDFPHNLFNVSHPHGKVLVSVPAVHTHIKAPDKPVLDGIRYPGASQAAGRESIELRQQLGSRRHCR